MNAQELIQQWIDAGIVNPLVANNQTILIAMQEGIQSVAERAARNAALDAAAQIAQRIYALNHDSNFEVASVADEIAYDIRALKTP